MSGKIRVLQSWPKMIMIFRLQDFWSIYCINCIFCMCTKIHRRNKLIYNYRVGLAGHGWTCLKYFKMLDQQVEWWWWWIVFVVWLTDKRRLALFPSGIIVRDPHHLESLTRRERDLNLCRTSVQALLNEVVQ